MPDRPTAGFARKAVNRELRVFRVGTRNHEPSGGAAALSILPIR